MTLVLSPDELLDLQGDLDVGTAGTVFTDAELNRLWNRTSGNYPRTVYFALRQLMVSASKWANYVVGQTQEARSDRFKQVQAATEFWRNEWLSSNQFQNVHIHSVPVRAKMRPYERWWGQGSYPGCGWGGGGGWGTGA